MKQNRPWTRGLILLCLLALQMQMFASSAMACKHARLSGDAAVVACHFHSAASPLQNANGDADMLDCQSCVLALLLSGCHAVTPAFAVAVTGTSPIEAGTAVAHFYRFVLDRLHRPPISLLG